MISWPTYVSAKFWTGLPSITRTIPPVYNGLILRHLDRNPSMRRAHESYGPPITKGGHSQPAITTPVGDLFIFH